MNTTEIEALAHAYSIAVHRYAIAARDAYLAAHVATEAAGTVHTLAAALGPEYVQRCQIAHDVAKEAEQRKTAAAKAESCAADFAQTLRLNLPPPHPFRPEHQP